MELGENAATWGKPKLNTALQMLEEAIAGVESIAIAGTTTTLTSTNYSSDQARNAVLVLTGSLSANSNVIVPNVEKLYLLVNNTTMGSYSLTVKTAAGAGVDLKTGPQWVFCDGTNVLTGMPRLDQLAAAGAALNMGGFKVTNSATPTATTDLATKAYVDSIAAGGGVDLSAYAPKASPTFTGVVTVPLGSVGSPGVTFSGDTNTGIYSPTADNVALVAGGTARATASSTGLAVTGTLTASGTVTASGAILGPAGSASAPSFSFSADPNSGLYSGGADIVRIATGGTDRVIVASNGDVTIGGTSPTPTSEVKYLTIKGPNAGLGYASLRLQSGLNTNECYVQCATSSADLQIGTPGSLAIAQAGTYSAGLDAAGVWLVGQNGTATPGQSGNTSVGSAFWRNGRVFVSADSFSNWNLNADGIVLALSRSGITVGSIGVTSTATSYNTSSDARLKDDIEPVTGALSLVAQVAPKRFRFKSEPRAAKKRVGFLAHEVGRIAPDAVTGKQDEVGDDNQPVYQQIDHSKLVPILWAAVAELAARVEALEAKK